MAVGPPTTTGGGDATGAVALPSPALREDATQAVRPGAHDPRVDDPPDELRRARAGGRACSRASGRTGGPTPAGSGPAKGSSPASVERADGAPGGCLVLVIVCPRPGHGVHEDGRAAPEPLPVALEADRLLEGEEAVEPVPLDVGRDVVRRGASPAFPGAASRPRRRPARSGPPGGARGSPRTGRRSRRRSRR